VASEQQAAEETEGRGERNFRFQISKENEKSLKRLADGRFNRKLARIHVKGTAGNKGGDQQKLTKATKCFRPRHLLRFKFAASLLESGFISICRRLFDCGASPVLVAVFFGRKAECLVEFVGKEGFGMRSQCYWRFL
jgi:hypothetical protein